MPSNPLKRNKTPLDRARAQIDDARRTIADIAGNTRDSAARIADLAEKDEGRRAGLLGSALALTLAGGYIVKRQLGGGRRDPATASPAANAAGPTDPRLNDPALKNKVESELFADESVPKGKIAVSVDNGVVTLRGTLESKHKVAEIASRAGKVEGVRDVDNLLKTAAANKN